MSILLDGNVVIALAFPEHQHAARARAWFAALDDSFATCPITQGSLMRFLIRERVDATSAKAVLGSFTGLPRHVFWPDNIGYGDVYLEGILGHGQVTDAYLAQLARTRAGRIATFDEGLAGLYKGLAELVP